MLFFATSVLLLIMTPGPGVLSTAGIGAAYGYRSGLAYVTGLFIGNFLVGLAAVAGLSTFILASPLLRNVLMVLSTVFILYLAYKIASSGSKIAFDKAKSKLGLRAGVTLQLINPKAYAVNMALFSGYPFLPNSPTQEMLIKFLIFNLIWIPVHLAWLAIGAKIHSLNLQPTTQSRINICMATALVIVVGLAFISFFRFS